MSLTLGLTGMDPATEVALKSAFADANERLNGHWRLLPESEAANVVVDMDSMYGPMSWLRLHAAGKRVIGLTTAPRTQTDFRLGRPFDGNQVAKLLREIAVEDGVDLSAPSAAMATEAAAAIEREADLARAAAAAAAEKEAAAAAAAVAAEAAVTAAAAAAATAAKAAQASPAKTAPAAAAEPSAAVKMPAPSAATPSGMTHAPEPQDQLPEELIHAAPPAPTPAVVAPPRDPVFSDWLAPAALRGRLRYRRAGGAVVLIDAGARQYHGPAVLKPLAPYFEGVVRSEDFEAVDDATWNSESAAAGPPQPLQRLQWFGGLLAGQGELLPGHDPAGRYKLNKWPQTEREFPKHFRIATAMMRAPATLADIAAASGIPLPDVADFLNASLVTGFAEFVPEPLPEPVEPPKPASLLDRLRGR